MHMVCDKVLVCHLYLSKDIPYQWFRLRCQIVGVENIFRDFYVFRAIFLNNLNLCVIMCYLYLSPLRCRLSIF